MSEEHTAEKDAPPTAANWWCQTCIAWHPKDMGSSPVEAHAEWERRVALPAGSSDG